MSLELKLLTPVKVGRYDLPNRMVMAPLTRNRAKAGDVPYELHARYYAQRASAGLIVTEASQILPQGKGYPATPGIYSVEQVEGWKLVTKAVHDQGGRVFLQLWHVGRISHPDLQPNGDLPVAPSAIAPQGMASTYEGEKPFVTPRALERNEISDIIEAYRQGAANALSAGFDGVEIHSANGYLLDQFLHNGSNQRTDEYGGSIENRARLLLAVTEVVVGVWSSDRVGIRLSPTGTLNAMTDTNPEALFRYVVNALNRFNLAYLHLVEPRLDNPETRDKSKDLGTHFFRSIYTGSLISAGGYGRDTGNAVLEAGDADLIAYGRWFISNPDLPERFALNAPLNPYDRSSFYGGDEHGYTDYPSLEMATIISDFPQEARK